MMSDNKDEDQDLSVHAEEYIEIISTEDQRIKIIGEELANDTGRAIFGKISQGISSSNDLAKALNISLPLVTWHINRLLSVGLIKIEKIEMSSKNKQMKYYGPVKTALVIIPPENPNNVSSISKKETVLMKLRHYMASFAAAIVGATAIYMAEESHSQPPSTNVSPAAIPQMASSIHAAIKAAPLAASQTPPAPPTFTGDQTLILISLISGVAIFFAVFFGIWFARKSKEKKLKQNRQII